MSEREVENAAVELTVDVAQLKKERDLLFDALSLHMRSTGIGDKAMARVDAYRAVIEHCKERVRGEIRRLEAGWRAAAKERDAARAEVAALARFKVYVHQRLDEAGIPTHPDGPHSKQGCRVGDRLDIALADRAELATLQQAYSELLCKTPSRPRPGATAESDRLRKALKDIRDESAAECVEVRDGTTRRGTCQQDEEREDWCSWCVADAALKEGAIVEIAHDLYNDKSAAPGDVVVPPVHLPAQMGELRGRLEKLRSDIASTLADAPSPIEAHSLDGSDGARGVTSRWLLVQFDEILRLVPVQYDDQQDGKPEASR